MKTLFLMRHAQCPQSPELLDYKRPLSQKGLRQAASIGELFQGRNDTPTAILCSNALRTRETLQALIAASTIDTQKTTISYNDILYNGNTGDYMHQIQSISDDHDSALLVGHNPVIPALVAFLADEHKSDPLLYRQLISYYTPATLTQVQCPITHWRDLAPYANSLITVNQPEPAE